VLLSARDRVNGKVGVLRSQSTTSNLTLHLPFIVATVTNCRPSLGQFSRPQRGNVVAPNDVHIVPTTAPAGTRKLHAWLLDVTYRPPKLPALLMNFNRPPHSPIVYKTKYLPFPKNCALSVKFLFVSTARKARHRFSTPWGVTFLNGSARVFLVPHSQWTFFQVWKRGAFTFPHSNNGGRGPHTRRYGRLQWCHPTFSGTLFSCMYVCV
jgi:hypothetical protein